MNELRINPGYDLAESGFLAGEPLMEYSHVANDIAANKLFLRVVNSSTGTKRLQILPVDGEFFQGGDGHLEFGIETGRAIGQAILDLCKEEDGE